MSNTITNVLPKILAAGLKALRQNAVMPQVVNTSYSNDAAQKGNVVNIPISSAIAQRDVTAGVTYATNVDFSPTTVAVTLDTWKEAPFQLSDNDMVSVVAGVVPMQVSEAIKSLCNGADQFLIAKHTGIFGAAGTAGTTPFNGSLTFAKDARKLLNLQLAPLDNRRAVLDPAAEGNLLINQEVLQTQMRGDSQGIINGLVGTKLGFDWYMDQNITQYTPGTGWASGFIASTVAGVIGQTTLNIISATASGQVKVGDIFTIVGDTSNGGSPQQYVVTVTTTVSTTVQSVITFYPAIKATIATGATLVVVSVAYTANLAFHRDAFAWASRPLASASIEGLGHQFASVTDPVSGCSLRLEVSRQYKQTTFSFDMLYGGALVRPELAVKILG